MASVPVNRECLGKYLLLELVSDDCCPGVCGNCVEVARVSAGREHCCEMSLLSDGNCLCLASVLFEGETCES